MCNDCYPGDISSFPSYRDYNNFEHSLNTRISLGYLNKVDLDDPYPGKKEDTGYITAVYRCTSCNSLWYFSKPYMEWRGFFLGHDSFMTLQPRLRSNRKRYPIVSWIIFILLLVSILLSVLKR